MSVFRCDMYKVNFDTENSELGTENDLKGSLYPKPNF